MTGASGALGRAVLARLPDTVRHAILVGREGSGTRITSHHASARRITYLPCDLAQHAERRNLVRALSPYQGQVTMVVHAAGLSLPCLMNGEALELLEKMLQVHAVAFADLMAWSVAQMDGARGGHIVAVSSSATLSPGLDHMMIAASKGCLEQLVRCYAAGLVRQKITVNAVLPGAMASAGGDAYREQVARLSGKRVDEVLQERYRHLPTDDLISPAEVADAIVGLLTQPGFSRTGNLLRCAGGKF